jgi:hypothetical protein
MCGLNGAVVAYTVLGLATAWAARGSNPARGHRFSLLQNRPGRLWGPASPLSSSYRVPSPELKLPGSEIDQSPPSIAEVNEWSYTSAPPIRLQGVDRNNFTFICGLNGLCVISGFRHDVDEICALLGYYAA